MLERQSAEKFKNRMISAAFIGWQNLVSNGYKENFDHYLSELGLKDKESLSDEDKDRIKERAYETGARVMNAFRGVEL